MLEYTPEFNVREPSLKDFIQVIFIHESWNRDDTFHNDLLKSTESYFTKGTPPSKELIDNIFHFLKLWRVIHLPKTIKPSLIEEFRLIKKKR